MAKKETTKKTTAKKEVVEAKPTEIVAPEIIGTDIDFTELNGEDGAQGMSAEEFDNNKETLEAAINAVDTDIELVIPDDEVDKRLEELKPLEDISSKWKEIEEAENKLNEVLSSNDPQKAENILTEEVKKAESLKKDIEKIITKPRTTNTRNVTSWWNGMGYDF